MADERKQVEGEEPITPRCSKRATFPHSGEDDQGNQAEYKGPITPRCSKWATFQYGREDDQERQVGYRGPITPRCSKWATFEYGKNIKRRPMLNRWTRMSYTCVFIFAIAIMAGSPTKGTPQTGGNTEGNGQPASVVELKLTQDDLHQGSLILVNEEKEYLFPIQPQLVPLKMDSGYIAENQTQQLHAKAADALKRMLLHCEEESGGETVRITETFRSYEMQEQLFKKGTGEPRPGHSEHHTGYAVDLGMQEAFEGTKAWNWLAEHCTQYGFILRQGANKTAAAGVCKEPWHFRYAGVPHAALMEKMGFDMEEYVAWLRDYPWDGSHLHCIFGETKYEIYFVPAGEGKTLAPVPGGYEYTVSGNNEDGFIVTVVRENGQQAEE